MLNFHLFHHTEDRNTRRKRVVQAFGDSDQWVLAEQPSEEQLIAYLDQVVNDGATTATETSL
jgi:hypothetical protein